MASRVDRVSVGVAAVVIGVLGAVVFALATATYGLVFLPLATPYLLAALSRRAELRADAHAAGLGYAQQLMAVLSEDLDREETARSRRLGHGCPLRGGGSDRTAPRFPP